MNMVDLLVGIAVVVGVAGVLIPVLPGSALILVAVLAWGVSESTRAAWLVAAAITVILAVGTLVKYAVPGRRLATAGVPRTTLWAGAGLGLVGFFVVPVLGLFLGFVAGIYLAEVRRVGSGSAWPSTWHAVKAVGLSVLIELTAAVLAATAWFVAAVVL